MKILKILGLIVVIIMAILGILIIVMPTSFTVERSVTVNAPRNQVYDYVKMFRNFHSWSPWSELDSAMKWEVQGNDGETGTIYSWSGNNDVGKGSQSITSMTPDRIDIDLKFTEPWESNDKTWFIFEDSPEGVKVTWGMLGGMARPMNIMGLFMNMEEMISKDYDKGLARMKSNVEKFVTSQTKRGYFIKKDLMPARYYISSRAKLKMQDIQPFYAKNFGAIMKAIQAAGLTPVGAPSGLYYLWDETTMTADLAAGIPVSKDTTLKGFTTVMASGKILHIPYYGAYDKSADAHYAMDEYMKENNLQLNEVVIEEYVTDPSTEPDTSRWLTNIYYLVK